MNSSTLRASLMPSAKLCAAGPRVARQRFQRPCLVGQKAAGMKVAPLRTATINAPMTLSDALSDDASRAALAEKYGFRKIGKELPDNVTLTDIVRSLPPDVFELDHGKAWKSVVVTLTAVSASLALIAISPWYMLPFAWALAGTAFTGFFVVGHDCGHRSFHKNNLVEDIVGTLMFMPLVYPFEPWRIKHNHHHAHTNKLVEDTAWHPAMEEQINSWSPTQRAIFTTFLGTPFKLWASVGHWWLAHFDMSLYTEKQKPRVIVSFLAIAAFAAIGFPAIIATTGFVGFVKFWLMPWLGYHFWMSTFTLVHHTAPHVPFKSAEEWNAAKAQLGGTVHCDYPGWVEFLCHDINVHVPHHVSSKIPWYNLRRATDSLRANWGDYMTECTFNWRMLKASLLECHVYDKDVNYKPFDFQKTDPGLELWRKVLPNKM